MDSGSRGGTDRGAYCGRVVLGSVRRGEVEKAEVRVRAIEKPRTWALKKSDLARAESVAFVKFVESISRKAQNRDRHVYARSSLRLHQSLFLGARLVFHQLHSPVYARSSLRLHQSLFLGRRLVCQQSGAGFQPASDRIWKSCGHKMIFMFHFQYSRQQEGTILTMRCILFAPTALRGE